MKISRFLNVEIIRIEFSYHEMSLLEGSAERKEIFQKEGKCSYWLPPKYDVSIQNMHLFNSFFAVLEYFYIVPILHCCSLVLPRRFALILFLQMQALRTSMGAC